MVRNIELIRGTSGAKILVGTRTAIKIAPKGGEARVQEQAKYMRKMGAPFARVLRIYEDRYVLERLNRIDNTLPRVWLIIEALQSLQVIWDHPAKLSRKWEDSHWAYVTNLLELHKLETLTPKLEHWFTKVVDNPGPVRQIHGDCTLDNMMEKDGEIRWIDPIPASDVIPPLMAVDYGKLLQSATGYEDVKYERPVQNVVKVVMEGIKNTHPNMSIPASYFQFVHLLRLLRYAAPHVKDYYLRALQNEKDIFLF